MPRKNNRKPAIIQDIKDGVDPIVIAPKYNVTPSYVYRLSKLQRIADHPERFQSGNEINVGAPVRVPVGDLFNQKSVSSIRRHGGDIYEDYLREFQGNRGIQIYKEMGNNSICAAVLSAIKMTLRRVKWYATGADDKQNEAVEFLDSCLTPETRIEVLGRSMIPIKDVRIGDRVRTHLGNFRDVTESMSFSYTGNLYMIKRSMSNSVIEATSNHPFLVAQRPNNPDRWWTRTGKRGNGGNRQIKNLSYKWINAEQIKLGDFLLEPISRIDESISMEIPIWNFSERINKIKSGRPITGNRSIFIDERLARLIGYYLADGCRDNYSVHLDFGKHETEYIEDAQNIFRDIFGVNTNCVHRGNCTRINASGITIAQFFANQIGGHASTKRVPEWLFRCP